MGIFPSAFGSNWTAASTSGTDALFAQSMTNLKAVVNNGSLADYLAGLNVTQTCDLSTAAVRKEYTTLSNAEKLEYSDAVRCLMDSDPVS